MLPSVYLEFFFKTKLHILYLLVDCGIWAPYASTAIVCKQKIKRQEILINHQLDKALSWKKMERKPKSNS